MLVGLFAAILLGIAPSNGLQAGLRGDHGSRSITASLIRERHSITIGVAGPLTENSIAVITIEGAPPPGPGGLPPFGVVVRLNGWSLCAPNLTWNPETQSWSFDYHIPLGQRGATATIAVLVPPSELAVQSFTVN